MAEFYGDSETLSNHALGVSYFASIHDGHANLDKKDAAVRR